MTADAPFPLFHVGAAAVASESLTLAHIRLQYDMTLPLGRNWGRPTPLHQVDIHRPRQWLVSFRGRIQNTGHPYYQHRWLAAEYWEEAPDVGVDVECKRTKWWSTDGEKITEKNYSLPSSAYEDMLWNSTFGFARGGSGVGSYRFGEILWVGGIPVVTQDFVSPLSPEVDWSGCVVRISEARIIDLPRILREFSSQDVMERQRVCWRLSKTILGEKQVGDVWRDDERVVFTKALEIWAIRISNALVMAKRMSSITT